MRANDGIVTAIEPRPDRARIAEAGGAFGATACEPTLRKALDEGQHGRAAP